jgi:hypothetical protein
MKAGQQGRLLEHVGRHHVGGELEELGRGATSCAAGVLAAGDGYLYFGICVFVYLCICICAIALCNSADNGKFCYHFKLYVQLNLCSINELKQPQDDGPTI